MSTRSRAALRALAVDVVADVAGSDEAIAAGAHLAPNVVIVDVGRGDHIGASRVRAPRNLFPEALHILTSRHERSTFDGALAGLGFIPKREIAAERLTAVAQLGDGASSPHALRRLGGGTSESPDSSAPPTPDPFSEGQHPPRVVGDRGHEGGDP
jgi:DNA-binding NarL/FixJ family response regulator